MTDSDARANLHPLERDAFEHCLFPLADAADVRRDGPTIYVRGEGVELEDVHGRRVLDMMSSHTRANSLGYGNAEIAQAVYDQMVAVHYVGTQANFAPATVELAGKLAALTPGRLAKCMFVSGGSEAVEAALKLAKQYHVNRGAKPRAHKIIGRWNAYHGATMGALAATDWLGTRHIAEPGVPGYSLIPGPMRYRNPFGMDEDAYAAFCAQYLERQIQHEGPDYVAAFLMEPIMQANGVQVPPRNYLQRVREICDRYEVLLIADEVITGFGRTGAWFAMDHFGVEPDIMTMAKALTAGYVPMGAVITRAEIRRRHADLPSRPHIQRPRRGRRGGQCQHRDLRARGPDRAGPGQRRLFPGRAGGRAGGEPARRRGARPRPVAGRRFHRRQGDQGAAAGRPAGRRRPPHGRA